MARKGLFNRVQPATGQQVTAELMSRLQDNIHDAVETLAKDHDVWSAPTASMVATGNIPAGASIVTFAGASGQTLTLPPANAQGVNAGAFLVLHNASISNVTISATRGDTVIGSNTASLAAGAMLVICSDGLAAWRGASSSGRLLRSPQLLTSGTAIAHPTGTTYIKVAAVGGGGGGGGVAASAAGQSAIASGGGGGAMATQILVLSSLSSTYVIGAAGTLGASGGGAGGNGGDTTFTHGGFTLVSHGGGGGGFTASAATAAFLLGGDGGGNSGGDVRSAPGAPGGMAIRPDAASPTVALSGGGGASGAGGGGSNGIAASGAGTSVIGRGVGGGGALSVNGAGAAAGAAGNQGFIVVEEYS